MLTRLHRDRSSPSFRLLVPALALVAAAGCSESSAFGGRTPTLVPDAEEVFRIGSLSGGSWETFSDIVSVQFDAAGHLYVLDGTERRLTVVDGNGRFVRTIGQAGDGPGEFQRPLAMAVLPDGRVVVSDGGHRGLLLFDADGTFRGLIPFEDGITAPAILHSDGADAVVYVGRPTMRMGMGGGRATGDRVEARVYRVEVDEDARPELVHSAWLPPRVPPRVEEGGGMRRMTRQIRAFEPSLHAVVFPDGSIAVADSTSYRIDIVRPGEGVVRTVQRDVAPTPVTAREEELEKERRLQEIEEGGGPPVTVMGRGGGPASVDGSQRRALMEAQLDGMVFWPEIQVIERLVADREGRLWVQRFGDVGEPGPIDILDRDGSFLAVVPEGSFEIPGAFGPDGLAAWVERDELDVPFVRVARLMDPP